MNPPVAPTTTRHSGQEKESLALKFLESRGASLVQRNFTCRAGEIDLVMRQDDYLVFVEVRFRRTPSHGKPAETVGAVKQARILRAAHFFLLRNPRLATRPCRFDVIGITPCMDAGDYQVDWIRDAFSLRL